MKQTNKQINNIRQERRSASETLKTAWDTKVSSAPINQHNGVGRALIDLCCELILLMPFVLFHFEMILYCVFNFEVTVGGGVLLECIKGFFWSNIIWFSLFVSLRPPAVRELRQREAVWGKLPAGLGGAGSRSWIQPAGLLGGLGSTLPGQTPFAGWGRETVWWADAGETAGKTSSLSARHIARGFCFHSDSFN